MASVTRYMVRYKNPYARPARYTTHTIFVLETDDSRVKKEVQCGGRYKTYNQFVKVMQDKYGQDIKVDRSKPYVNYK